jgi:DNA-binding IclR family transcriptional regulator
MQFFEIITFDQACHKIALHHWHIPILLLMPEDRSIRNFELQRMTGYCQFTIRKKLLQLIKLGLVEQHAKFGYYQITESGIKRKGQFYEAYTKLMKEREGM